MAAISDYGVAPLLFSALFNILLGLFLLRLRHLTDKLHMTLSQRWGLTLLGWLYIINTLQILAHVGWRLVPATEDLQLHAFFIRAELDLVMLSFFPLLSFGLVYPRLVMGWERLRIIILLMAIFFIMMIPVQSYILTPSDLRVFETSHPTIELLYLFATFIPIFLWLPEYEKQSSPQMRMILTILIWGYLFIHIAFDFGVMMRAIYYRTVYSYGLIVMTLCILVIIMLLRAMYYRRGRWSIAEWTNLFLIIISLAVGLGHAYMLEVQLGMGIDPRTEPGLAMLEFMTTFGGWTMVRPALFFYGLVRFQVFGPELKADRSFTLILTVLASGAVFILVFNALVGTGLGVAIVAGLVVASALFIPFQRLSRNLVDRLLPMSGGGEKVPLAERRITYLMGLQTAIVMSEIGNKYDKEALEKLRRALKVSEREHELLMSGFARERPLVMKGKVEEVYIFHMDGSLLGHCTRTGEMGDDYKKDMMATIFTAVGEFSKDALRTGTGHMDAIEYGDSTLLIEVEGSTALGIMLKGKDNPQVRQRMRDLLMEVRDRYKKDLRAMDKRSGPGKGGVGARFKDIGDLLQRFLKE